MKIKVAYTGPMGDARIINIEIKDRYITITNPETDEVLLNRPVYGYEQHLWNYIEVIQMEIK